MIYTIKLKINGMHCASCSMNIDGELEEMDGVLEVHTSYAKSVTVVKFDSEKISLERIQDKIKSLGYEAEVIS